MGGHLGDQIYERLRAELLDPLCVEAGQVVGLSLSLGFAGTVERPVL